MSPADTSYKTYNRLVPDDFVISQPKAWEGAIARVTPEFEGWYLSPVFPTFRAKKEKLDTRFLEWFCRREPVWAELQGKSRGIGARRETVSADQFLTLEIPLPPLAEQQRIVVRIEELAAKIQEARTLRHQAAKEADAFVTSLHVTLSGSRKKKLGDILRLDEDKQAVEVTDSYPQVGIRSFGAGLFPKSAVKGTETSYRTFNRLYDGAIILSQVKGWEGAVTICSSELAGWFASPEYRTFRCIPSESRPKYLAALVRTKWFWNKLAPATRGVGARRERTRPEQFLNIELAMPDVDQQIKGEALFKELNALHTLHTETAAELDALLPSLLDHAFKGEL